MTLEKDSHILRPCMIASRTIQHNGDRTYDISFTLLSYNEENDQKVRFRDLKCRNGAQNQNLCEKLSSQVLLKILTWLKSTVNGQSQQSTDDVCWRGSVTSPLGWCGSTWNGVGVCECVEAVCPGAWGIRTAHGGTWSVCSWGRNFSQRVEARVRWFLAVLGWVLLGIVCFVTQCLCFDSWMSRMMRFESCWDCGRDDGDLLLTVTTGWRRGQWKNAGDVHRNQKVRGMALIPC